MVIGVAIIGSGNFAKEQHLPAVQAATDLQLKAIYSRSLKSAQALSNGIPDVDLYSNDSGSGNDYDDLLARSDIGALLIGLPILVQPDFIKRALLAGKHVLSEKPIAKDVATARELLKWYQANIDPSKVIWAVGENFRYMTKFLFAAEKVREMGKVRQFRVNVHSLVKQDNKYYLTSWRQVPEYQGGFLLDGGVHMVAGLRLILGSTDHMTTVSAQTQQLKNYLPPIDTVDAVVATASGATGVISLSWGSDFNDNIFEFACEKGVVTMRFDSVTVNGVEHHIEFDGKGVGPEVAEFAKSIVNAGSVAKRQSPDEALADLEVLEQMLQSGEKKVGWMISERGKAWQGSTPLNPIDDISTTTVAKRTSVDRPLVRASAKFSRLTTFRIDNSTTPGETLQHRQNTTRFFRHQSDRFMRVGASWRKPKGIDNCVRRRFKGVIRMPKIGYGSNKKTRHMMPSGHKAFLVHNPKDVELLLMHNRTYAAEIAHAVSSRKRVEILAKAKALGVKVTNAKGRVTTEA
ncbi:hypothetical protein F1880_002911 [Penicillium rolfsii]|nr:hypothetical protein F1880_002911 [Penicillium rolfsii]